MNALLLLSLIIFLPAIVALGICFIPKRRTETVKWVALGATVAVFLLTVWIAIPVTQNGEAAGASESPPTRFVLGMAEMQQVFTLNWIPEFNIYYCLGIDGISFPLILLTSFLSMLAMGASWRIDKHLRAYCVLFLLLETGMLGVFMALDFFLFYVFWEVMLLPMYFLIGVWGGPRKEYAAIKFFLFTLVGSVLILVALLMLYFASDLRTLDEEQIKQCRIHKEVEPEHLSRVEPMEPIHTFNLMALAEIGRLKEMGQLKEHAQLESLARLKEAGQLEGRDPDEVLRRLSTLEDLESRRQLGDPAQRRELQQLEKLIALEDSPFDKELLWGKSIQWWAFLLLFIGFLIKVPGVPLHTWLPDAHVEAPTPISMILAGVLLKMGGYGIIRICYPICPDGAYQLAWLVCTLGTVSMVYGAFAAMAQKDFKRLVAYSSVSHMGYVVLGLGVWSIAADNQYMSDYWKLGMNGAMFQMIAHGLSSAGMFFLVGVIYDRVHHRDLDRFGGLFARMPVYSGISVGIFFAAMGLPGLCGFIGEVFVVLSVWNYSTALAVVAASVMILTAGYILWTIQRVYLGPEYNGPHGEALTHMTRREFLIGTPLLAFAIVLGVYPQALFNYMQPSVDKVVDDLGGWTKNVKQPRLQSAAEPAAAAPKPEAPPEEPKQP